MRIRNMISGLAIFSLVMVLGAMNARADQITLSDTCTGNLTVTAGIPGAWSGSVTGCLGSFDSASLGELLPNSTWTLDTSTGAFTFVNGSNTLTGTVTLDSVVFGLSGALLEGALDVTGITGGVPLSAYSVGGVYDFKLTVDCPSNEANPNPSAPAPSASCSVSDGEIPVPEPGSLALFGSGLVGLAGYLRRKIARS